MKRNQAVVIGGSMGGLVAARVLTDHFERVTLLERDVFPPAGEQRRGVPQGRHTHGLLASGREVLDKLFPGLSSQLIASGALAGDIVRDGRWFHAGGCLARVTSGLEGLLLTRPMLEGAVRDRVRALPNLSVIEDATATGLQTTPDRRAVAGISYEKSGGKKELAADLVVDATGRGSKSAEWLGAAGYDAPPVDRVEVALSYTSRFFRREPHHLNGDLVAIIPPTPEGKRGGVMLAQEGNRWTVTLISHFGPSAPLDLDGFRAFASTLPAPYIHEVIRDADPVSEPASARFPASVRSRYEKLARFPEGFLVFGDAISSFNPIYGQGMSVAALESGVLDRCLREGSANLAPRFFRAAAKVVDIPWSIAVGNDLRMKETVGPRSAAVSFINWYMSKLHKAAHHDAELAVAFHRVANLLAPPESILHPRIAMRVLRGGLRRSTRNPADGETGRAILQTWNHPVDSSSMEPSNKAYRTSGGSSGS